jgi:hypothetical protein
MLFFVWTAIISVFLVFLLCDSFKSVTAETGHADHHPHQHTALTIVQHIDYSQYVQLAVAFGLGALLFSYADQIVQAYKNLASSSLSLFLYLLIRWRHPLLQLFRRGILNSKKYNLALV